MYSKEVCIPVHKYSLYYQEKIAGGYFGALFHGRCSIILCNFIISIIIVWLQPQHFCFEDLRLAASTRFVSSDRIRDWCLTPFQVKKFVFPP